MDTRFAHLELVIDPANIGFYRDLMGFLGWPALYEAEGMAGFGGKSGDSLWFIGRANGATNDYDGAGLNHIGIGAGSQADVDATVAYLETRALPRLFETPRHRPDFAASEADTYYQVMFESPDHILFEVVYTGPKS